MLETAWSGVRRGSPSSSSNQAARTTQAAQPWQWPSLICLDAPLIAVAWQWTFANCFHQPITPGARIILFLTTWAIYLADRLADVASLPDEPPQSLRQRFCRRYQAPWRLALVVIAVGDGAAILLLLDRRVVVSGGVIGALVLIYLIANHVGHRAWRSLPIKEMLLGSLFAMGTVSVLLSSPAQTQPGFALSVLLFAALCAVNAVHIAVWERSLDHAQQKTSLATRFPGLENHLLRVDGLLAGICGLMMILGTAPRELAGLVTVGVLALGAFHIGRSRSRVDERIAMADLALLAPLGVLCLRTYL